VVQNRENRTNHLSLDLLRSRVHIFNNIIFLRAFDFIPARPFLEQSSREAECICHVVEIIDTCPSSV
jgi:hypothetical protein